MSRRGYETAGGRDLARMVRRFVFGYVAARYLLVPALAVLGLVVVLAGLALLVAVGS